MVHTPAGGITVTWCNFSYAVEVEGNTANDPMAAAQGASPSSVSPAATTTTTSAPPSPSSTMKAHTHVESGGSSCCTGGSSRHMKTLLYPSSGAAVGQRLLAIMGPSGAGKTTLLNGLIGRLQRDTSQHVMTGCVFLNDVFFTERYKKLVSFVAQDDIVMGKETPFEALYVSCRLRLGLTHEEGVERTEDILTRLHLQECKDTYMGVPGLIKGVSGGEKKRANIGNELITNPYIMLLDEPTSGLDSVNALRVGHLLRDLAHVDKRTVICTIHSPSSELFGVFDDLMLLAKGRVVYHGPLKDAPEYFASVGYPVPPRTNPSEYYMNVLQMPDDKLRPLWDHWQRRLLESLGGGGGVSGLAAFNPCLASNVETLCASYKMHDEALDDLVVERQCPWYVEVSLLTWRSWHMVCRDLGATVGRAVQTVFFAVLMGLFFFQMKLTRDGVQDRAGGLFMFVAIQNFMAVASGLAAFPPERAVFLVQQASENYRAVSYFIAKNIAELPFQVVFPLLFATIIYFFYGLVLDVNNYFIFVFHSITTANLVYSFGLCMASIFPAPEMSFAAAPLMILPMMVVAGLFANTARLDPYFLWLTSLSFPRYGFVGLMVNEFGSLPRICADSDRTCPYKTGDDVLKFYGFDGVEWYQMTYPMIIYQTGLRVVAAISLWFQGRRVRGNLNFARPPRHQREEASTTTTATATAAVSSNGNETVLLTATTTAAAAVEEQPAKEEEGGVEMQITNLPSSMEASGRQEQSLSLPFGKKRDGD